MSQWVETLVQHLAAHRLPKPEREVRVTPERKWRFDLAWPERRLAVEVDGGIWTGGRHTSGKGYTNDCEKVNTATVEGWRVLRVVPAQIKSGQAVEWIRACMGRTF